MATLSSFYSVNFFRSHTDTNIDLVFYGILYQIPFICEKYKTILNISCNPGTSYEVHTALCWRKTAKSNPYTGEKT